jgi:hypothetical protein
MKQDILVVTVVLPLSASDAAKPKTKKPKTKKEKAVGPKKPKPAFIFSQSDD